jgi:hypothetical protein
VALSTTSSLSQEVQSAIAAELLIQPDDVYQFIQYGPIQQKGEEAKVPGTTSMLFDRPVLPTGTYTETSRRLTEGTAVNSGSLAVTMTQTTLTTREYGGPHDGSNVVPFGITEFLKNRSKHDVIGLVGGFLRRDRNRWLDTVFMNLLLAATTVITPDASAEGAITAGQAASAAWLSAIKKSLKDTKIPPFPNGNHRLIINTRQEKELKADTTIREQLRYLTLAGGNPLFAGYVGTYDGLDMITSTMLPTKGVGSASAVTGYQAVAFGPHGIGQGIAMEPEPRYADDTDFGRQLRVMWVSNEAIGMLYSDLTIRALTT